MNTEKATVNAPRSLKEIPRGVPVFWRKPHYVGDRVIIYACPDESWAANFRAWQEYCAQARASGLHSVAHIPEPFPAGHVIFEGRSSEWMPYDPEKPLRDCTGDEINLRHVGKCSFAYPGTYGHECGRPATVVGVRKTETGTSSGFYFALRCPECAQVRGGENAGTIRWEPYNPVVHVNEWR